MKVLNWIIEVVLSRIFFEEPQIHEVVAIKISKEEA